MNFDHCSNTLLRYLADEASLFILILDRNGCVVSANEYARKFSGKSLDGLHFSEIILDFTSTFRIEDVLQGGNFKHLLNVPAFNGLPQTFYFRFLDEDSSTLVIGEQNHLDVENMRKNLVSLTNEINNTNRELHKKNAELAKLGEQKNLFLGIAAHDLRAPIGVILNLSKFLLEEAVDNLPTEHVTFLSLIQSRSEFMLHLLNNLLDISKIEAGKLVLNLDGCDVVALIKSCTDTNQILAKKKGIRLKTEDIGNIGIINIDAMKIEQVLNNLLSNAIKFSEPGGTITINARSDGVNLTVSVADKGPGIPESEMNMLFLPFSKTSVRSSGGEKCTGLGLAIVRKIILAHKGKVWVESSVGYGTTLYFSIPFNAAKGGIYP